MGIELRYTALGSGYYKVMKNGVEDPPNHITEREAQEHAGNLELANPDDVIRYYHDYEVSVEAVYVPDPDTASPSVSITVNDVDLLAGEVAEVTFTFSEPVVNFDASDVTVENGTLGPVSSADGGVTWTATFVPAPDLLDASNVIGVTPTYSDAAGNTGTGGLSPNISINTEVESPPSDNPLDSLTPGTWYRFPNSLMSSVDPCPGKNCSYSGIQGQKAAIDNWSSGVYDTKGKRLLVWGGGHSGYGGNEVYAFGPLDSATPAWTRLTEPSEPTLDSELYADGTPSSRHNYGTLQYDPVGDRMFALSGGSVFSYNTKGSRQCHSFDLVSKTWKTDWNDWLVGDVHNTASEWDAALNGFWVKNSFSNQVVFFDPAGNGGLGSWTPKGGSWYSSPYMTLAIDTNRHLMFGIGGSSTNNKKLNRFDLNANALRSNPVSTGDAGGMALETAQAPGFVYDPVGDRFIGWQGGTSVYQLNPVTYEWLKLANHESNSVDPGPHCPQGTYGRMRYVPEYNGIIVVSKNTDSVYFYKLTTNTQVAVPPVPVALVNGIAQPLQTAVSSGGTVTVGEGALNTGASVAVDSTTIIGAGKDKTILKGVVSSKGILVVKANSSISHLALKDATGGEGNEAGIRHDSGILMVADVKFENCLNGYLGNGEVDFLRCVFDSCGKGDGFTHAAYISSGANQAAFTDCSFKGTKIGHHLKSRAKKTLVDNVVMEAATESYSCDFPWGGEVSITGLNAAQGQTTDNAVLINYGSETNSTPYTVHSFSISDSVLSSTEVTGALAIRIDAKTPVTVYATNVDFNGFASKVEGGGVVNVVYTNCRENGVAIPDTI